MKNLIIAGLLLLSSCGVDPNVEYANEAMDSVEAAEQVQQTSQVQEEQEIPIMHVPTTYVSEGGSVQIIEVQGCEYVLVQAGICHKGNCKNTHY